MSKKKTPLDELAAAAKHKHVVVHAIFEDKKSFRPGDPYDGKHPEKFLDAGLIRAGSNV